MAALRGVISYPIPPYQNVAIRADYYMPSRFEIAGVTLGQTTVVTTSAPHNYVIGQEIRLIIPPTFGCRQLNQKKGFVLTIPTTASVEVTIDSSRDVDAYVASSDPTEDAQIVPIGDVNTGYINNINGRSNVGIYIPGSFRNISPQ